MEPLLHCGGWQQVCTGGGTRGGCMQGGDTWDGDTQDGGTPGGDTRGGGTWDGDTWDGGTPGGGTQDGGTAGSCCPMPRRRFGPGALWSGL